jgi:hypothetical protein
MKQLLAAVILLGALLVPLTAFADPFVPDRPAAAQRYGTQPPLYDDARFDVWAYTFEGDAQTNSIGYVTIYFWMNQLLVGKAWLLKTAIRTTEYAVAGNFFSPLADSAGTAMQRLGDFLWSDGGAPLVVGALSFSGLWAILLYMRGRISQVWAALGGTVLILMVTGALLATGVSAATSATDLARQISVQAYRAVEAGSPGGAAGGGLLARSGDAVWRAMVYEPWVTGEFGSAAGETQYGKLDAGGFLGKSAEARRQTCDNFNLKQTYCPWWQADFLPRRMLLATATGAATLVYAGSLLVLAGSIILAQLTVLLLLALAPAWLLVGIWWPGRGSRLLKQLCLRLLGALVGQMMLAAALAVLLYLTVTVSSAFPATGWMFRSLLLAGLAGLALKYRYAWLEPLVRAGERRGDGPVPAGWLAWMRARWPQGQSRTAAAAAGAQSEAVPVFAAVHTAAAQLAGGSWQEPQLLRRQEEPVVGHRPATAPEAFRSQMDLVRERFSDQGGPPEAEQAPDSAGGTAHRDSPASGGRPARASRDGGAAFTQVRSQRPRP